MRLALLLSLLALAGCNDRKPPHWEDVCVSSFMIYQSTGDTLSVKRVCVRMERRCIAGKNIQVDQSKCPKERTT